MFDEVLPRDTGCESDSATNLVLKSLLATAPGPRAVEILAGLDGRSLDEFGQVLLVQALERQSRWLAALTHAAVAALQAPAWTDARPR